MEDRISVFVNGHRVLVYRGMKVKHALIAFDRELYTAAVNGTVVVEDARGLRVGMEGALHDGASLSTRDRE
jgi:hypothetical protein